MIDIYFAVGLIGASIVTIVWLALRRPSFPDAEPTRTRGHQCHLCRRAGYYLMQRADTGEWRWTCPGCKDEGIVRGFWAGEGVA